MDFNYDHVAAIINNARLKSGRLSAGYSCRDDAAEALDVETKDITKWEKGKNVPCESNLIKIMNLYKRHWTYFIMEHPDNDYKIKKPVDLRIGDYREDFWNPDIYFLIREVRALQKYAEDLVQEVDEIRLSDLDGIHSILKIRDKDELKKTIGELLGRAHKPDGIKKLTYLHVLNKFIHYIELSNPIFISRFDGVFNFLNDCRDSISINPYLFAGITLKSKLASIIMINGNDTYRNQLISVIRGVLHLANNKSGIFNKIFNDKGTNEFQKSGMDLYKEALNFLCNPETECKDIKLKEDPKTLELKLRINPGSSFINYIQDYYYLHQDLEGVRNAKRVLGITGQDALKLLHIKYIGDAPKNKVQ